MATAAGPSLAALSHSLHVSTPLQVLTWAVVEEHVAAAARLSEALAPGGEAAASVQQAQQARLGMGVGNCGAGSGHCWCGDGCRSLLICSGLFPTTGAEELERDFAGCFLQLFRLCLIKLCYMLEPQELEELEREHEALKQAVEGKVGVVGTRARAGVPLVMYAKRRSARQMAPPLGEAKFMRR